MTDARYLKPGLGFAVGRAAEECGEFLAALGKTLRWGRYSVNPELPPGEQETNQAWLNREIADLREALDNLEAEMERDEVSDMRMVADAPRFKTPGEALAFLSPPGPSVGEP